MYMSMFLGSLFGFAAVLFTTVSCQSISRQCCTSYIHGLKATCPPFRFASLAYEVQGLAHPFNVCNNAVRGTRTCAGAHT